jgi:hypothetical protein
MRYLTIFALTLGASANFLPAVQLERRAPFAGGGWGLAISDTNCPSGYNLSSTSYVNLCCPNGFSVIDSDGPDENRICCPSGMLD